MNGSKWNLNEVEHYDIIHLLEDAAQVKDVSKIMHGDKQFVLRRKSYRFVRVIRKTREVTFKSYTDKRE